jgi:hypothetical protein
MHRGTNAEGSSIRRYSAGIVVPAAIANHDVRACRG